MTNKRPTLEQQRAALLSEFNSLIGDAENLLRHTSEYADEGYAELRRTLSENIDSARARLIEGGINLQERSLAAAQNTEQFVKQHPWQAVGVAAGIGLVLGLLLSRR